MKTLFTHPVELTNLLNEIATYDAVTIEATIGMLIDICADQRGESHTVILAEINEAVNGVNAEMGHYNYY